MTNVWPGPVPAYPQRPPGAPRSSADRSREGGVKWWMVTLLSVISIVAGSCAVSYVGLRLYDNFTQSLAGIGKGFQGIQQAVQSWQRGGTAASAAADVAAPQSPSSLSLVALNSQLPDYQWVDGATRAPPSSSHHPIVGISVSATHLITAVRARDGTCSFGLAITLAADPLIAQDHLPGPGTYYAAIAPASTCVADQPPTSSWQTWRPNDF